jgi:voltage-gated potassium channel
MGATGARPVPPRPGTSPWVLLRPVLSAGLVLVVYAALPLAGATSAGLVVLGVGLAALGAALVWQVRAVIRSPVPRLRAVEALATTVPLFLVLFASVYLGLSRTDPGAFTEPLDRTGALYFAVTVFATVGFGDIAPVAPEARIVTTIQMVTGLVLLGGVVRVFLGAVQLGLQGRPDSSSPDGDRPGS